MKFLDQYEVNIYGVIVVVFLIFAIGYTVLIVRQQQIISQMASAHEKAKPAVRLISPDKLGITAKIGPLCSSKVFSLDSRQANSQDLKTPAASIISDQGKIELEIDRNINKINADTELIIRGQGYLSKKKSVGDATELDFGTLIAGDVNADGAINQKDIDALNKGMKSTKINPVFDLNCDDKVDATDHQIITAALGKIAD